MSVICDDCRWCTDKELVRGHRRRGWCRKGHGWVRCAAPRQCIYHEARRELGMPWPDATEAEVRAVATLSTGCARRCGIDARTVAERILRVLGWTYNTRRKK